MNTKIATLLVAIDGGPNTVCLLSLAALMAGYPILR